METAHADWPSIALICQADIANMLPMALEHAQLPLCNQFYLPNQSNVCFLILAIRHLKLISLHVWSCPCCIWRKDVCKSIPKFEQRPRRGLSIDQFLDCSLQCFWSWAWPQNWGIVHYTNSWKGHWAAMPESVKLVINCMWCYCWSHWNRFRCCCMQESGHIQTVTEPPSQQRTLHRAYFNHWQ